MNRNDDYYCSYRHKPTFGEDVNVFQPERWLKASTAKREIIEKFFLCPFEFGSRLCLSWEISLLEVYKILATLVSKYDIGFFGFHVIFKDGK